MPIKLPQNNLTTYFLFKYVQPQKKCTEKKNKHKNTCQKSKIVMAFNIVMEFVYIQFTNGS